MSAAIALPETDLNMMLFSLLALTPSFFSAPDTTVCDPMPGAVALRDAQQLDFIIMGEAHGTAELPAAFADLVCAYAATGSPLTVGLEFLPDEQPAIDAYLASVGDEAAKAALLASPAWTLRDGRASQAIFSLVESLRKMKAVYSDIAVIAFDHPSERPGTSAAREKGMADVLLSAKRARPTAPVLALTGNGHAGKSEWTSLGPPFPAMSQYLPADRTIAISFHASGGEIWACGREAPAAAETCGPRPMRVQGEILPRGISLGSHRPGFDATVSVGTKFTASSPAKPVP